MHPDSAETSPGLKTLGDIIGNLLLLGVFLGLEVVAIVVLILSAAYARQLAVVITCGIVAAVVMAAEYCFCFIWAAGGLGGEALPIIVAVVSIVSLGIYFPIALRRCKRRQASDAHKAT